MRDQLWRDELLEFMKEKAYRPLTFQELVEVFGISEEEEELFRQVLKAMEAEGLVVRTRTARYGLPERMNLVVGHFHAHQKGFGFVIPDREDEEDLYIPPEGQNGAMHGDRVVARVESSQGGRRQGEIIRILSRAVKRVVGVLERHRGLGFVVPDDRRLIQDIYIPRGHMGGARTGEKVVVEITRWPSARRGPEGRVVERLGKPGDPGVDIRSLMVQYDLPEGFPPDVLEEAARLPQEVLPEDKKGRADLTDELIFTIDTDDAKDLDDAVSLEKLPKGGWRLGVHIADVSHYVPEGSALDREARERATSVYLVDRVVPMLPPELSNGICSLNPQQDRLAVSVFMDFDEDGTPGPDRVVLSVIRSKRRFTYTEVNDFIESGKKIPGLSGAMAEALLAMDELAQRLRARRRQRGSIDFDLPEPKVILNPRGEVLDVLRSHQNRAAQLIEEFMLAANEAVARRLIAHNAPAIFRVHEPPDPEKIQAFQEFLYNFGIPFQPGKEASPKAFQEVLEKIAGRPEEHLISTVMLRSMRQARYATEPLGHFGLATRWYTHFTAPIRRYPDLVVHRIIKELLPKGQLAAKRVGKLLRLLPGIASHASQMERKAMEAERESLTLKILQYMQNHVGEEYEGIISGVTAFGFFVQLPNLAEGLVHVSTLTNDYYTYQEKHYALIGERTGTRFRLGDKVRVKVMRVDLAQRQMDFQLVMKPQKGRKKGKQKKAKA
ncbi:MAG: ribonuclease R [Clostridiales bacterium]|nr:ribonuclease R [Clostridiales bacterium]